VETSVRIFLTWPGAPTRVEIAGHYGTAATLGPNARGSPASPWMRRRAHPLPDRLLLPCSEQHASNQPGQGTGNISTARYKEALAEHLEVLAAEKTL